MKSLISMSMHLYAFIVRYFERMDESFNGLDCESPKWSRSTSNKEKISESICIC